MQWHNGSWNKNVVSTMWSPQKVGLRTKSPPEIWVWRFSSKQAIVCHKFNDTDNLDFKISFEFETSKIIQILNQPNLYNKWIKNFKQGGVIVLTRNDGFYCE